MVLKLDNVTDIRQVTGINEFKIIAASLQGNSDHALYQSGGLVYWIFTPRHLKDPGAVVKA